MVVNTTPEPRLRINPAEMRHVNAVMAANEAHALPLGEVKVLCLSLNAQNPSLREETATYLHIETGRRQQSPLSVCR